MNLFLDLLFPKRCVGCKGIGSYFCQNCISNILQTDLVCPRCEGLAMGGQTHPICKTRYGLDGLWSLGIYQGSLREALKQVKYHKVKEIAFTLTDIVISYWAKYQPFIYERIKQNRGEDWAISVVPLYWFRENNRGFNQSSLIGRDLSEKLGLNYIDALKRTRYTKPQVGLKSKQRQSNIRGAFSISQDYLNHPFDFILLIDDVWTTGATLKECSYVLKRSGVKQVWALTLAR